MSVYKSCVKTWLPVFCCSICSKFLRLSSSKHQSDSKWSSIPTISLPSSAYQRRLEIPRCLRLVSLSSTGYCNNVYKRLYILHLSGFKRFVLFYAVAVEWVTTNTVKHYIGAHRPLICLYIGTAAAAVHQHIPRCTVFTCRRTFVYTFAKY